MDIGMCDEGLRRDRALGDKSAICSDAAPLGRVVIGVYGRAVPTTAANFVAAVRAGLYTGSTFSKVLPGEWLQAGRQGSERMGEVGPPPPGLLAQNQDVLQSSAFKLRHLRPGTVSLALAENDDDPAVRMRSGYRNTEFLITTGPGPVPALDGGNVVFGRVLEGMDTVAAVATVPTLRPMGKLQAMNRIASLIGDDRAAKVRAKWGKPLKAVVITAAGVLEA